MHKKILFYIFIFIFWLFVFFYFSLSDKNIILNNNEVFHNWLKISEILNQDNYSKIWINPDKYPTFEWFLNDFKSYSWVHIDPINEKFVIWLKWNSWSTLYIPFDFKNNKEVFDDKSFKNLAILDIYIAYKNDWIYWWEWSKYQKQVLFDNDFVHPTTSELNDIFSLNVSKDNNLYTKISTLEKSKDIWYDNMELLAYLYDFIWKYNKANDEREKICSLNKDKCNINTSINIKWLVLDNDWNPVSWTRIELLNDSSISTNTDDNWKFSLNFKNSNFSHLRLRAYINWYSDWYNTISVNNIYSDSLSYSIDFKLTKADNIFYITDANYLDYKKGKYYVIKTDLSTYFVPIDGLFYDDNSNYLWKNIEVYTYLFKKSSNMDSLLENDTFEPVYWYVWNIMKTFWMPYIQFVDKDTWKELFIKSSNPMVLQNQIYHMKELYENFDKIYEPLTKDDMKYLVDESKKIWWYPIDFKFLTENQILRWPAWWTLDRKKWLWENVWCRVLNVDWLVELPFYHINDN